MTVIDIFPTLVFAVAVFAGATASVVGFGIGSLLTPLLATRIGTSAAIAAVTLPHACATVLRCWRLRAHIDRSVLMTFGLVSAGGALAGALAFARLGPTALTRILGLLLLLTAVAQISGWAARWRPRGAAVVAFGLLSGFFGGIAGNQGGLRSAAMTAFGLDPLTFVATATATGVLVDAARTPVYVWVAGSAFQLNWGLLIVATAGVIIGTLLGERILFGLSQRRFGQTVGAAVGVLGVWLLFSAG